MSGTQDQNLVRQPDRNAEHSHKTGVAIDNSEPPREACGADAPQAPRTNDGACLEIMLVVDDYALRTCLGGVTTEYWELYIIDVSNL